MKKSRALTALLLLTPAASVGAYVGMVALPGTTAGKTVFLLCKAWMVLLPAAWHVAVDRQSLTLPRCSARWGNLWAAHVSHVFADVAIFVIGWGILFEGWGAV